MNEQELQTLWQEQPLELAPSERVPTNSTEPDYAVPTTQFSGGTRRPLARIAVVLAAAAAVLLWVNLPRPPPPEGHTPSPDPAVDLEAAFAKCKRLASQEDLERAVAACEKVAELAPLHHEGLALLAHLKQRRACEAALRTAREQLQLGELDGALTALQQVGRGCDGLFASDRPLVWPMVPQLLQRFGEHCQAAADAGDWPRALQRCERYAQVRCQSLPASAFTPPPNLALKLEGRLDPKSQWRPADPLLTLFLRARAKALPGAPAWTCPSLPALSPPAAPPRDDELVRAEFSKRFPLPRLGEALTLYFNGRLKEAAAPLQAVLRDPAAREHHEVARALLAELDQAASLLEQGSADLLKDQPEAAAEAFREALRLDASLVLGARAGTLTADELREALKGRTSFLRRAIEQRMGGSTFTLGRERADQKDLRGACQLWRLGLSFSRGNLDLLKATTNVCTRRAAELYSRASNCEELQAARDFAIDGDGFREKIDDALVESGCR